MTFVAEFVAGEAALLYAGGSALRPDVSGPGYFVFAPVRVLGGGIVIVDRGFVPEGQQELAVHASGISELVGVLRWPEPPGWFTPKGNPARNLWRKIDYPHLVNRKSIK